MPREFPRSRRVGEQIQRELSELIRREIKDPRVGMVTVMEVRVTRDLGHAKVFVSFMQPDIDVAGSVAALNHAAGFLRRELGREMKIRTVPELHFVHDESLERGARLSAAIDRAVASDRERSDDQGQD
ncbi:MAG: 30S ribosome-binding factor RbfA [Gammaproteobacteria bacterium]|jgi:ribosome-binding factor A